MANIPLGPPISTRDGFTVQIVNFDIGSRSGYNVELIDPSSGVDATARKPDKNGIITVQNLKPGETTKVRVTLSGDSGTSATGTPLPGDALVPLLGPFEPTADGCRVPILNMDNRWTFMATVNNVRVDIKMEVVVVKDKQHGQPITVMVTSKKLGHADGTSSVPGFASPLVPTFAPPIPTNKTGFTVQISNHDPAYAWAVAATSGTVGINNTGLITVTGLIGEATQSTVTVTTSRGVAPNAYAPGTETVTGESMNLTMRWIHVGLSAPEALVPSSNNNQMRDKYVLNKWGDQKEAPVYEVENISHLTPKEMKAALMAVGNIKDKDVLIGENDLLDVNEIEREEDDAPKFRYYWSQQNNRQIIDSVSSTTIKMNDQAETKIYLDPTEIQAILFSDVAHDKISRWGNQNNTIYNLLTTEDGPTRFFPLPDGKIPSPRWKLKQVLQSGSFSGALKNFLNGDTNQLVGSSKHYMISAWSPALTKNNNSKLLEYPIDITVTVMLEYTITAEVRSYIDFTQVAIAKLTHFDPAYKKNLKLPGCDSTRYILKRRVPISMVIPYNMTRTFTDTAPQTLADVRNNLPTSACVLKIATDSGREDGSMEKFRNLLLEKIPSHIQSDIDEFLKTGPFYYDSFGKTQKGADGRNIINWRSRTSYIPEQVEPKEGQNTHETIMNKKLARAPVPRPQTEQAAAMFTEDGVELKPPRPAFNGCYKYITYNIDLDQIQAATSDIFISSIKVSHTRYMTKGYKAQPNPIIISFYNDLDSDMRALGTDVGLELGVVDGDGMIDAKDLIPQFYQQTDTKVRGGVHILVSGVGDSKGLPTAGWVDNTPDINDPVFGGGGAF